MTNATGILETGDTDQRNAVLVGVHETAEKMTRTRTRCGNAATDAIMKFCVGHRGLDGVDCISRAGGTSDKRREGRQNFGARLDDGE